MALRVNELCVERDDSTDDHCQVTEKRGERKSREDKSCEERDMCEERDVRRKRKREHEKLDETICDHCHLHWTKCFFESKSLVTIVLVAVVPVRSLLTDIVFELINEFRM